MSPRGFVRMWAPAFPQRMLAPPFAARSRHDTYPGARPHHGNSALAASTLAPAKDILDEWLATAPTQATVRLRDLRHLSGVVRPQCLLDVQDLARGESFAYALGLGRPMPTRWSEFVDFGVNFCSSGFCLCSVGHSYKTSSSDAAVEIPTT